MKSNIGRDHRFKATFSEDKIEFRDNSDRLQRLLFQLRLPMFKMKMGHGRISLPIHFTLSLPHLLVKLIKT
jgi:hypothetical protein